MANYLGLNPPIAHFDLKSPNVLLTSMEVNGSKVCAKISDFGTAREVSRNTKSFPVVDNPVWKAPEILSGDNFGNLSFLLSYFMIVTYIQINEQMSIL
jgi:serine/threonine protein kinase